MNKDQFNLRHSNLNIDQNELNRKYSGYLQEQEEIEMRAMYEAFSDNKREIVTKDILLSLKNSVPISVIMKEEINALRLWASERARNASIATESISRPVFDEDDL